MPLFELESEGKRYQIDAPDIETAGKAFEGFKAPALPEDPAERAAMTMRRQVRPPGGRLESAPTYPQPSQKGLLETQMGGRMTPIPSGFAENDAGDLFEVATGRVVPKSERSLTGVLLDYLGNFQGSAAPGMVKGLAGIPGSAPRYARGGMAGAVGRTLADMPAVGTPIRESAAANIERIDRASLDIPKLPTGDFPDQKEAGRSVLEQLKRERKVSGPFQSSQVPGTGLTEPIPHDPTGHVIPKVPLNIPVRGTGGRFEKRLPPLGSATTGVTPPNVPIRGAGGKFEKRPPAPEMPEPYSTEIKMLMKRGDAEDVTSVLMELTRKDNVNELARIIGANPNKSGLQGAFLERMGATRANEADFNSPMVFSPDVFIENLKGMSTAAKNLWFGDRGPTREAIESIMRDRQYLAALRKIPQEPTKMGYAKAAAPFFYSDPITALAHLGVGNLLARWVSRPAMAASLSSWHRAYIRFAANPDARGYAALKIATQNLENNTGTKLDLGKLMPFSQPATEDDQRPRRPLPLTERERQQAEYQIDLEPGQTFSDVPNAPPRENYWQAFDRELGWLRNIDVKKKKDFNLGAMRPSTNIEVRGPNYKLPTREELLEKINSALKEYDQYSASLSDTPLTREAGGADLDRGIVETQRRIEALRQERDRLQRGETGAAPERVPMPRPKPKRPK